MKTRIVRIGNSQGLRIPKPLLEAAGLDEHVRLRVTDDGILVEPVSGCRSGWKSAAERLEQRGEGGMLDASTPTDFDDEWVWK